MRELTKQWNSPITRLFEIDFSDFQPNVGPKKNLPLTWVQKRTIICFAQIKNTVQFSGPDISIAELFLTDAQGTSPPNNLNQAFVSYDVSLSVGNRKGKYRAIPERQLSIAGVPTYQILNFNQGQQLFLVLRLALGESINNLTQGQAWVWFQYIRMR
ncbi:MAG: hypothetical protein ACE5IW_10255 [bacterium]